MIVALGITVLVIGCSAPSNTAAPMTNHKWIINHQWPAGFHYDENYNLVVDGQKPNRQPPMINRAAPPLAPKVWQCPLTPPLSYVDPKPKSAAKGIFDSDALEKPMPTTDVSASPFYPQAVIQSRTPSFETRLSIPGQLTLPVWDTTVKMP